MGCYIWYSEEKPGRAAAPPSPLLAVPNVTSYPSTASVYKLHIIRCGAIIALALYKGLTSLSVHLLVSLRVCLYVRVQMYDLGLPSFISNTLEQLNIGTYHDIATVSYHPQSGPKN